MAPTSPDVPDVIVSGHICLDLILEFESDAFTDLDLESGALVLINQAKSSTGGAVANTGLALHRLGVATSLMAKVGEDLFGQEILRLLRAKDPQLVECMRIDPDARTSFTAVINPVGKDHTFLHLAGANDSFGAEDVSVERISQARLFHFGYPPIMKRIRQVETSFHKIGLKPNSLPKLFLGFSNFACGLECFPQVKACFRIAGIDSERLHKALGSVIESVQRMAGNA
ncbi:MAG: carbohydrate kinase family protein [Planctomycetes bacterium]|nr:carbohydrate kinase family protein [Planctomycetota bacterium]